MSNTANVIAWVWATVSGAAFGAGAIATTIQAPDIAGIPWEKIGATGAAGAVLLCVWFFLRRDAEVRKEHAAQLTERDVTIKAIASDFSETSTGITRTFAETTKASEERAERREKELREWMHNLTRDKA